VVMEDCYAKAYCTKFGDTVQCNYECIAYHQMNTIFELSGLPKRYRYELPLRPDSVDLPKYRELREWIDVHRVEVDGRPKYVHNVVDKVNKGLGLFLWSDTKGNGKTSWAAKILQAYFRAVGVLNNMRTRGLFINVPEFLEDMRRNMDTPSAEHKRLVDLITEVDLVVFDDIGTESPTKWVREQLYIIINKRYSEGKACIFTSNISLASLGHEEILGDRIASRITGFCDMVEFKGTDRREGEKERRKN
jgi:DNA replication protein DnaC